MDEIERAQMAIAGILAAFALVLCALCVLV